MQLKGINNMSEEASINDQAAAEKLLEILKALPKHPSGAAGVALAIANSIHSCNHVIKVHGDKIGNGAAEAGKDRAKLVTALVNISNRQDFS